MQIRTILILSFLSLLVGCRKEEERMYTENDSTIRINNFITIDNGVKVRDPIFNYIYYDDFLKYISSSDHFLIVRLKDFDRTNSTDKVVIALRYDVDENIPAAVRLAYREHKYGIRSTYFVLHTADYYGKLVESKFIRSKNILSYLQKLQDEFGHEIGFHNDLVTLQLIYDIPPKEFLRNELTYLRGNNINIAGTTYHGSQYCYKYHYYNAYFWKEYPDGGWNYEYLIRGQTTIKIEKDNLQNYNFEYEGGLLHQDYFFSDANFIDGKRCNMSMVNLDTIKPGKKIIILLHPANWD